MKILIKKLMKSGTSISSLILLSCYLFLAIDDLIDDLNDDIPKLHIYANTLFIIVGFMAIFYYSQIAYRSLIKEIESRRHIANLALDRSLKLEGQLDAIRNGVVTNIHNQFMSWSLSKAEREIAFLLLKGFSFKEISSLRSTSEKTVRDQAAKIYLKSGIKNRAEFVAYFLEDLLS